ncbi:hypothetical protein D3C81_1359680 [compost metagenome]
MAVKGRFAVVRFNTGAVIGNADELEAPLFDGDFDFGCSCVNCVLHQFLNHRRRAFHHFPGSNLVGNMLVQYCDFCHCYPSRSCRPYA